MKTYKVEYSWDGKMGSFTIPSVNINDLRKLLMDAELDEYIRYAVYHKDCHDVWVYSGTMYRTDEFGDMMIYLWDNGRFVYEVKKDGELFR